MNDLKIGIVIADPDEYKPLIESVRNYNLKEHNFFGRLGHEFKITTVNGKATVFSVLCGIGKVNAAAAAMHLADSGCDVILNCGLSGGISNVSRGDVALCTKFIEHDFDLTGIGYKPCEKPNQEYIYSSDKRLNEIVLKKYKGIKSGTAVSGDSFICDSAVKESLSKNFGAMSCDMETAAIAYVCSLTETPFMAIRRISDDAGESATDSYREMNSLAEAVLTDILLDIIPDIIDLNIGGKSNEI